MPQTIIKCVSFFLVLGLLAVFSYQLFHPRINTSTGLVGEPIPTFQLTDAISGTTWNEQSLKGKVSLINVWATWCHACELEHPMLMKISHDYHIPIYSIDYKDNPELTKQWLLKHGNPFTVVGNDQDGNTAIDLGIYGTPETFVINKQGYIIYRHMGVIDQDTWDQVLYPLILKYQRLS